MAKVERVLIVGGGLAGLALSIALRQRGVSAALVEGADEWGVTGAGLYLVGNATRAVRALEVGDDAVRNGFVIRRQSFFDHRGRRLAEIDAEAFWQGCGPCLGIAHGELHQSLVRRANDTHIRLGTTVQALRQDGDHVWVQLSDGCCETYDLVVGADGIRSCIRRLAFVDSKPCVRGQVGWRFLVRRPLDLDGWRVFLGPRSAFLMLPIASDLAYCYADKLIDRPVHAPAQGTVVKLREAFADFACPVCELLAQLDSATPIHFAAIEEVATPCYGRGRVALIGDAAHAMSPNMACGAAMAFEDALVLAEIVSHLDVASELVPELIRRRSARIEWVRSQADRRDRTRSLPSPVRDVVLRLFANRLYRANYRPLLAQP